MDPSRARPIADVKECGEKNDQPSANAPTSRLNRSTAAAAQPLAIDERLKPIEPQTREGKRASLKFIAGAGE